MSIVRGLVLAHVSVTTLLLLVFLTVVLWQRLTGLLRRDAALAPAYPADVDPSVTPVVAVTVPEPAPPVAATAPASAAADGRSRELQPSS